MIEIQAANLAKSFEVGQTLLDGLTFQIEQGEHVGILGRNGAGKSTLFRLLTGELDRDFGQLAIAPGRRVGLISQIPIYPAGYTVEDVLRSAFARLDKIAAELRQLESRMEAGEADNALLRRYDALSERFARFGGYDTDVSVNKIVQGLSIPEEQRRQLFESLSGGEKTRVNLGRLILEDTDVLLLDEPTNHLDVESINWLEDFLAGFENTVIVVSHDRHFLNQVCTYICDVDFGEIKQYAGNYDFWYESSQLALQMAKDANKKKEEKIKELQTFIQRFAANAAKSKQATSRKKMLDKITLDDIKPSSRRYPYIAFTPDREAGDQLLTVEGISKTVDGEQVLKNVSFTLKRGDKVAFVGPNSLGKTMLFKILMGEEEPDEGSFKWGITTTQAYLPADNSAYFDDIDLNLVDWLRQYSKDPDETFVRGFLGRMLFSGEESQKKAQVLSGGERVRCMLSRMMLSGANVLLLDEPTNHLDLESITALNNGLMDFKGTELFVSHDHQFVQTIANRIIHITPDGVVDRVTTYDEFLANETVKQQLAEKYKK